MPLLIAFLSLAFLILSLLHLNWAIGGKWALDNALPTNENGEPLFMPRNLDSAIVGLGLLFIAGWYFLKLDFISVSLPLWAHYIGWIVPTILILRAIGDFKYIGFFKRVKSTNFGRLDSKYYSPLCLILGLIGLIVEWMN